MKKPAVDRLHAVLGLGARRHRHDADDRCDHADGAHEQREHHPCDRADRGNRRTPPLPGSGRPRVVPRSSRTGRRPCRRSRIDVVAHVVGDRRRVAGSSSGMPCSILPTRSAPSAAFVKMPPPTRMNIARSAAEAEADQHARRVALEDDQDQRGSQQAEADREHAGHPAGTERDRQRLPEPDSFAALAVRTLARTAATCPHTP